MKFILAIESSCDNTCISIINNKGNILLNYNINQDYLLLKFGGFIPNILCDSHSVAFDKIFNELDLNIIRIVSVIAVTTGPGLIFSLAIGHRLALFISYCFNKPLFYVDHIEAHLLSPLFNNPSLKFPFISMIVSGGHFLIFKASEVGDYKLLARSLDDSPGEVFDKIARKMKFDLATGKEVEKLSKGGILIPDLYNFNIKIQKNILDYGNREDSNLYFYSFSGIKTRYIRYISLHEDKYNIADICFTFQEKIFDTINLGLLKIIKIQNLNTIPIAISGGVASNNILFYKLKDTFGEVHRPGLSMCIDNSIMIANCYLQYENKINKCYNLVNKSFFCRDINPYDRFIYS